MENSATCVLKASGKMQQQIAENAKVQQQLRERDEQFERLQKEKMDSQTLLGNDYEVKLMHVQQDAGKHRVFGHRGVAARPHSRRPREPRCADWRWKSPTPSGPIIRPR